MGDTKKIRKKYSTPMHPWQKSRIEEERPLIQQYGLVNKREIYKMRSKLTDYKDRVKSFSAKKTAQTEIEGQQLHHKLVRLGLLKQEDPLSNALALTLSNVMDRRLQTILVKLGYARTAAQARQMITHGHVMVAGKKITTPSHLTTTVEEGTIGFVERSPFINEDHPERKPPEKAPKPVAKKKMEEKEEEIIVEPPPENPEEVTV
jgi:small subunit ribosomal protein S4